MSREPAATFRCQTTTFTHSLPRFLFTLLFCVSLCLSVTLSPSLHHAIFQSPFSFSPRKCPTLPPHSKTAHPTQTSQGCSPASSAPVCSFTPSLCSPFYLSFTSYSLLIPPSKGFPPSTYISTAERSVSCYLLSFSSCILLPLPSCHFPPFFALILSPSSSSVPVPLVFGPPFLSFVCSISEPFFQSSLSSLLLHLPSTIHFFPFHFPFSTLSVLRSLVACCSVTQAVPSSPGTRSLWRTNIANVICLCVHL